MIAGRLDDFLHALLVADIARVDAQTGRPRFSRLDPALIMEMDVRHDGNRAFLHDFLQRGGAVLVRHTDAHDVGPGLCRSLHLRDGARNVGGDRVGHGLHADRSIAPDRHVADMDLSRLSAVDIAPGAHVVQRHEVSRKVLVSRNIGRCL